MQALHFVANGIQVFVDTLGCPFVLQTASTATPDGITIVAATGAGGGNWLRLATPTAGSPWQTQSAWFVNGSTGNDQNSGIDSGHALLTNAEVIRRLGGTPGDRVVVRPLGGGLDDWARLFSSTSGIALACAATGTALVMAGGNWLCNSNQDLPSNLLLIGTPETLVLGTISTGVGIFQMLANQGIPQALQSNNVPGTNTVSAATAPVGGWVVGSFVQLQCGVGHQHGSQYQIIAVSGAGPYTLTLDRVVLYQALAANALLVPAFNVPEYIRIVGNGMQLSGDCGFIISDGAVRCEISSVVMVGTVPTTAFLGALVIDTWSYECKVADCIVLGALANGAPNIGIAFEFLGEGQEIYNCIARDCTTYGYAFGDVAANVCTSCEAYDCGSAGFSMGSDGAANGVPTTEGNFLQNCMSFGNSVGFQWGQASADWQVIGCRGQFNGTGCDVGAGTLGQSTSISFSGCSFVNNTLYGLFVEGASPGSQVVCVNLNVSNNGSVGILAQGDVTISGLVSTGGNAGSGVIDAGMTACVIVDDYDIVSTVAAIQSSGSGHIVATNGHVTLTAGGYAIQPGGTTTIEVSHLRVSLPTAGGVFNAAGSANVCQLDNISCDGAQAGASVGLNAASGCTMRIGDNVNVDNTASPYNIHAGSFWNRSALASRAVTLTGTTPVVVSWPQLLTSDDVIVELTTPTGTVGPVKVTKTPSTGFSLAGTNGSDTSVVNYVVR